MQRLTMQRVMLIILFILLLTIATRIPVDTDTWWHLRSGEHTLTQGMIYTDPFSHTFEGERWINHSWGSQIVMLMAWNLGGDLGLALYTSILATVGYGVSLSDYGRECLSQGVYPYLNGDDGFRVLVGTSADDVLHVQHDCLVFALPV